MVAPNNSPRLEPEPTAASILRDLLTAEQARRRAAAVDYARESAFLGPEFSETPALGLPDRLLDARSFPFGPALCKLTPWRHYLLLGYASPFVAGGECRRRHLWQALFLCGPALRVGSPWPFLRYQLRTFWFVTRYFQQASAAFTYWLDAPFAFMPPLPVGARDSAGRPAAGVPWLVTLQQLGRLAGFTPREVLHTPYTVLWPSLEAVLCPARKDMPRFNRKLDKARGEYLRAKNAAAAAGRPGA